MQTTIREIVVIVIGKGTVMIKEGVKETVVVVPSPQDPLIGHL